MRCQLPKDLLPFPILLDQSILGFATLDSSHTYSAMYDVRKKCFNKAALVGRVLSVVLPLQNKSFLQIFVVRQFDVRLYKITVNLSIIGNESRIQG